MFICAYPALVENLQVERISLVNATFFLNIKLNILRGKKQSAATAKLYDIPKTIVNAMTPASQAHLFTLLQ